MRFVFAVLTPAVLAFTCAPAAGQALAPPKPSFEVASVKVNESSGRNGSFSAQPGGRLSAINVTLESLIQHAYDLQRAEMTGLPDWARSQHFDVVAKAETGASGRHVGTINLHRTPGTARSKA